MPTLEMSRPHDPDVQYALDAYQARVQLLTSIRGVGGDQKLPERDVEVVVHHDETVSINPARYLLRLAQDAEHLRLFYDYGLKGLNKELDKLLNAFHHTDFKGVDPSMIRYANDLIVSAIYLYPHVISTIEMTINRSHLPSFYKIDDRSVRTAERRFNTFDALMGAEGKKPLTTFSFLLPFGRSLRGYELGEGKDGYTSVSVSKARFTQLKNKSFPILIVFPLMHGGRPISIPIGAVESIAFSSKTRPTPFVSMDYSVKKAKPLLYQPKHPILHYLAFRGFQDTSWWEQYNFLIPKYNHAFLWQTIRSGETQTLHRGFVVRTRADPADFMLFEYQNITSPRIDPRVSQDLEAFTHIFETVPPTWIYHGTDIVRRLMGVPVYQAT